jgi:hypothetical protein
MPGNIEVPVQSGKARDGLLSVKEAAAYLKMSPNWLYSSGIPFARLIIMQPLYLRLTQWLPINGEVITACVVSVSFGSMVQPRTGRQHWT